MAAAAVRFVAVSGGSYVLWLDMLFPTHRLEILSKLHPW